MLIKKEIVNPFKEWKPSAEKDNKFTLYNLGVSYNLNKGIPQDFKEAFKWLSLSAEQGFKAAQYYLGVM